jgi:hypothetical protein
METRKAWAAIFAGIALIVVGTAVALIVLGTAMRNPAGRGQGRLAATPEKAEAAPGDTGVARGGPPPKGQAPAVALTLPRFLDAFNAETQNQRLLIMLSPT